MKMKFLIVLTTLLVISRLYSASHFLNLRELGATCGTTSPTNKVYYTEVTDDDKGTVTGFPGGYRQFCSNCCPAYDWSSQKTPNTASEQDWCYKLPLSPKISTTHQIIGIKNEDGTTASNPIMSTIGVARNGVHIYGNANAEKADAYLNEAQTFDQCSGHPQNNGDYHYHSEPKAGCVVTDTAGKHSELFGFMLDGIPIYGSKGDNGVEPTDLDSCGGHTDKTYPFYHYHFPKKVNEVPSFPYTLTCLKGCVFTSNNSMLSVTTLSTCKMDTSVSSTALDYSSLKAASAITSNVAAGVIVSSSTSGTTGSNSGTTGGPPSGTTGPSGTSGTISGTASGSTSGTTSGTTSSLLIQRSTVTPPDGIPGNGICVESSYWSDTSITIPACVTKIKGIVKCFCECEQKAVINAAIANTDTTTCLDKTKLEADIVTCGCNDKGAKFAAQNFEADSKFEASALGCFYSGIVQQNTASGTTSGTASTSTTPPSTRRVLFQENEIRQLSTNSTANANLQMMGTGNMMGNMTMSGNMSKIAGADGVTSSVSVYGQEQGVKNQCNSAFVKNITQLFNYRKWSNLEATNDIRALNEITNSTTGNVIGFKFSTAQCNNIWDYMQKVMNCNVQAKTQLKQVSASTTVATESAFNSLGGCGNAKPQQMMGTNTMTGTSTGGMTMGGTTGTDCKCVPTMTGTMTGASTGGVRLLSTTMTMPSMTMTMPSMTMTMSSMQSGSTSTSATMTMPSMTMPTMQSGSTSTTGTTSGTMTMPSMSMPSGSTTTQVGPNGGTLSGNVTLMGQVGGNVTLMGQVGGNGTLMGQLGGNGTLMGVMGNGTLLTQMGTLQTNIIDGDSSSGKCVCKTGYTQLGANIQSGVQTTVNSVQAGVTTAQSGIVSLNTNNQPLNMTASVGGVQNLSGTGTGSVNIMGTMMGNMTGNFTGMMMGNMTIGGNMTGGAAGCGTKINDQCAKSGLNDLVNENPCTCWVCESTGTAVDCAKFVSTYYNFNSDTINLDPLKISKDLCKILTENCPTKTTRRLSTSSSSSFQVDDTSVNKLPPPSSSVTTVSDSSVTVDGSTPSQAVTTDVAASASTAGSEIATKSSNFLTVSLALISTLAIILLD